MFYEKPDKYISYSPIYDQCFPRKRDIVMVTKKRERERVEKTVADTCFLQQKHIDLYRKRKPFPLGLMETMIQRKSTAASAWAAA